MSRLSQSRRLAPPSRSRFSLVFLVGNLVLVLLLSPALRPDSPMGSERVWFCSGVRTVVGQPARQRVSAAKATLSHVFGMSHSTPDSSWHASALFDAAPNYFIRTVVGTVRLHCDRLTLVRTNCAPRRPQYADTKKDAKAVKTLKMWNQSIKRAIVSNQALSCSGCDFMFLLKTADAQPWKCYATLPAKHL